MPLDRKIIAKLIESEKEGRLKNARLMETEDGTTALEVLRQEMSEGRQIYFVLMDYVMVKPDCNSLFLPIRSFVRIPFHNLSRFVCMVQRRPASYAMSSSTPALLSVRNDNH